MLKLIRSEWNVGCMSMTLEVFCLFLIKNKNVAADIFIDIFWHTKLHGIFHHKPHKWRAV